MNGWGAPDASGGRQQAGGGGGFQNFNNGTAAWGQQNGGRGGFDQARTGGSGGGGGSGLEMEILNRTVPRIIGRGGSKIKELEEESGARIKIHKDRDNGTTTVVELIGSPDAQARARQLIEAINSGGDSYRGERGRDQGFSGQGGYGGGGFSGGQSWGYGGAQSLEISVPSSTVGKIIGKGGSKIRELQDQSGARIKIHKDRDDGQNTIVELQGDRNAQMYAKQLVEQVVADDSSRGGFGNQGYGGQREGGFGGVRGGYDEPGLEMFVPSSSVARVIGKGGSKIREFQEQSGCRIKIRKDRDDGANTVVELIGAQSAQQHAKQLIESFLSEGEAY